MVNMDGWHLAILESLYSWVVLVLAHCENAKIIDSFGVIVLTSRLQLMYSFCGYFEWEVLGPLFSCQNLLIGLKSRVLDG
jgi:hypothetical protein